MLDERNPWSVRGVSREARAKAAKAARRRRMTMGEWVDYVLTTSANAELSSRPPAGQEAPPTAEAPGSATLPVGADHLEQRLVSVERREKELLALVERAVTRTAPTAAPDPALSHEVGRLRSLGEGLQGLLQRIDAALRPMAQIGDLIRRVEDGEQRQRQILLLMERLVEHEVRRKDEIANLAAALARIERRETPRPTAPTPLAPPQPQAQPEPPAAPYRYDFAALNEQAVSNSRRAGQREPGERRSIFGRRQAQG